MKGTGGAVAVIIAFACIVGSRAFAQEPSPSPAAPPPADCSVVGVDDASRILGYAVDDADANSQAGGICVYPARDISEEGVVSYAVVTADWLPERRAFFRALARRCGSVVPKAPNYAACVIYREIAFASDLDAYYAARIDAPDAAPVANLGRAASTATGGLYVRTKNSVLEVVVRRGDDLDVDGAVAVAKLLLARLPANER